MKKKKLTKLAKILIASRAAKKTGNNGLSKRDQERLFNALVKDVGAKHLSPSSVKKTNLSNFAKVADEIMGDTPAVTKSYINLMEKWIEPYSSGKKPLNFSQYQSFSQTAWFRSLTNDNLQTMQQQGVTKVKILAYMDDRTTEICQAMHGRVFTIDNYKIDQDIVTYERIETIGVGSMPSKNMRVMLPPYHFNCRTTFVEWEEPNHPIDQIKQKVYDIEKLSNKDISTITDSLRGAEWLNKSKESNHYQKHGYKRGLTRKEYQQQIIDSLEDNDNMYLAINRGNKNLTLTTVKYLYENDKSEKIYLYNLFLAKSGKVITSHLKKENNLRNSLNSEVIKLLEVSSSGKQKVMKGIIMKKKDLWNYNRSLESILSDIKEFDRRYNYPYNHLVDWYKDVPDDIIENVYFGEEISRDIPARYDIHTLLMNDYVFTQEERNLIERTDKKLLDNIDYYFKKIKVISSDELAEFLTWLTDARETENKLKIKE